MKCDALQELPILAMLWPGKGLRAFRVGAPAAFGTQRSLVQIQSPRLTFLNDLSSLPEPIRLSGGAGKLDLPASAATMGFGLRGPLVPRRCEGLAQERPESAPRTLLVTLASVKPTLFAQPLVVC